MARSTYTRDYLKLDGVDLVLGLIGIQRRQDLSITEKNKNKKSKSQF